MENDFPIKALSVMAGIAVVLFLIMNALKFINQSHKLQHWVHRDLWGHALYRWIPTGLAVTVILIHAIASPTWWRIASGTKVRQGYEISINAMRDFSGLYFVSRDNHSTSDHLRTRRLIQMALDAERQGTVRQDTRGQIVLPAPKVTVDLIPQDPNKINQKQHIYNCDFLRENCRVTLQSLLHYVHIIQGPNFVSRVLIEDPVLIVEQEENGVSIDVNGIANPTILQGDIGYSIDNFTDDAARLELADGTKLSFSKIGRAFQRRVDEQQAVSLSNQDFAPFDLTYTMDFTTPQARVLRFCNFSYEQEIREGTRTPDSENTCIFEPEDIKIFTLIGCDPSLGACPNPDTAPLDDLKNHDFTAANLVTRMPMGFTGDLPDLMFEIANRLSGDSTARGLIALPNRTAIVKTILTDYLTVTGIVPDLPAFDHFLAANPDINIQDVMQTLTMIPDTTRQRSMAAALKRQPQLWAWHSYAAYIGPELITGLMHDLVTMGLARPA